MDIDGLDFLQWQTGLQTAGYDRDLIKPESCLEAAFPILARKSSLEEAYTCSIVIRVAGAMS